MKTLAMYLYETGVMSERLPSRDGCIPCAKVFSIAPELWTLANFAVSGVGSGPSVNLIARPCGWHCVRCIGTYGTEHYCIQQDNSGLYLTALGLWDRPQHAKSFGSQVEAETWACQQALILGIEKDLMSVEAAVVAEPMVAVEIEERSIIHPEVL